MTSDRQRSDSAPAVLGKAYDARLMARLWEFVRPHWVLLALSLVLIPVGVALELAQPYLLALAIDVHIAHQRLDGLLELALLFVGCVGLQAAASYGQLYSLQLLGQRSMHGLRKATYRHVITRREAFFDRRPIGMLLTRLTNDIENINEMFVSGVPTLLADVVKLIAILGMMLFLNVTLTLITITTIPLLVLLVSWARRLMRTSFRKIRIQVAAMNAHVQEHVAGMDVVQLFGRQSAATRDYQRINAAHRDAYLGVIRADATMYAVVEAVGVASAAGIAWLAGSRIAGGVITVGLVVAFIEYVNKFFTPIRDLSAKYTVMQSAMAAAERVVQLLDSEEPDAPMATHPAAPAHPRASADDLPPAIQFSAVHFAYRPDEPVLRGIDFSVERGQTIAVVGATGSGKSTLIKLITRLYDPTAGTIRVDGRVTTEVPAAQLRDQVTVVSQDVALFAGTVRDNVRLGSPDATDSEIDGALDAVGAGPLLERRGSGSEEQVGERAANFSAGERQLIAFARALVRSPEILILDEATAHVDPALEQIIEAALPRLMRGRTSLVVAHRLSTIQRADQILVMAHGRIIERGSRDELLALNGQYAALERTFAHH